MLGLGRGILEVVRFWERALRGGRRWGGGPGGENGGVKKAIDGKCFSSGLAGFGCEWGCPRREGGMGNPRLG